MRQVFQQSLTELQDRLVGIAEMVESSIEEATRAFSNSDAELAEGVIERSEEVDEQVRALDELAISLLLRQAPVARDLRLIVGALRMSTELERMSDLAQHIAQLARYRYPETVIPKGLRKTFAKMAVVDVEMAELVVQLLRDQEPELVSMIRDLDDVLDAQHAKVFEKVLSDKLKAEAAEVVDSTLASRYHERFGDHAVNIAKQMQFFFSGELA